MSNGKYVSAACHVLETVKDTVAKMHQEDRKQEERDKGQQKLQDTLTQKRGVQISEPSPSRSSKNRQTKRSLTFLLDSK